MRYHIEAIVVLLNGRIQRFQNDDYLNGSNTIFLWRTWGGPLTDDEKVWNQLVMGTMILKNL
jgi:hypothetical protein